MPAIPKNTGTWGVNNTRVFITANYIGFVALLKCIGLHSLPAPSATTTMAPGYACFILVNQLARVLYSLQSTLRLTLEFR